MFGSGQIIWSLIRPISLPNLLAFISISIHQHPIGMLNNPIHLHKHLYSSIDFHFRMQHFFDLFNSSTLIINYIITIKIQNGFIGTSTSLGSAHSPLHFPSSSQPLLLQSFLLVYNLDQSIFHHQSPFESISDHFE